MRLSIAVTITFLTFYIWFVVTSFSRDRGFSISSRTFRGELVIRTQKNTLSIAHWPDQGTCADWIDITPYAYRAHSEWGPNYFLKLHDELYPGHSYSEARVPLWIIGVPFTLILSFLLYRCRKLRLNEEAEQAAPRNR
jgi:hypothetical protein